MSAIVSSRPETSSGMVLHWNFSVETAVRLGRKLEPFDLAWIEDPVHPEKLGAQRQVREALSTPVLTGEQVHRAVGFADCLREEILDIAAPDVTHCGGLGELRTIAKLCDLHGVPVAPHNISSPVGTVAGAHVGASVPNLLSMEFHAREVPWWGDAVSRTGGSGPILSDGTLTLLRGPGLGIELVL